MRRLVPLLTILAFGVAAGHLAWLTFGNSVNRDHRVGGSLPTLRATDRAAKNVYLRQTVNFHVPPKQAWIEVIGRGKIEVYANGHFLGHEKSDVSPVAVIADLAPHLVEGKNVIAVVCRQEMRQDPPVVAIQGEYVVSGARIPLSKMGPWRQRTVFDRRADYWFGVDYNDHDWPLAEVGNAEMWATLPAPARAFSEPTRGAWLSPSAITAKRVAVGLDFEIPEAVKDGWLRVQANCACRVAVNGVVLDDGDRYLGVNNEVAPETQWIYDISSFVGRGSNTVRLQVQSAGTAPQFLVDLECMGRSGKSYWFASGPAWKGWRADRETWLGQIPSTATACQASVGAIFYLASDQVRKVVELDELPWSHHLRRTAIEVGAMIALAAAAGLFVSISNRLPARLSRQARGAANPAIVSLVPTAVLFAAAILTTFDPRVSPQWFFQPWFFALGLVLVPAQWLLLVGLGNRKWPKAAGWVEMLENRQRLAITCLVAALVVIGAYLRLHDLTTRALSSDEETAYRTALGFWKYGFPAIKIHKDVPATYVATSELMHLLNSMVAGVTANALLIVRVTAVCSGILTILLVYICTKNVFGPSAGLIASAIYALSPVAINMAQWGRYCSQLQLFTLLSAYFFYRALESRDWLNHRALWCAVVSFICMFLSWEGSVLIALPMIAVALMLRRDRLRDLFGDFHVWLGLMVVASVVLAQMGHRTFIQIGRPFYGTGASDVQLTPMWRYPDFDLWYFVRAATWNRDILLPFLALATALLLVVRHPYAKPARAFFIILLGTGFLEGLLMPIKAVRYGYHLLPFWLMLGGAGLSALAGELTSARRALRGFVPFQVYSQVVAAGCIALFVALASGWTVDLARLEDFRIPGTRLGSFIFPGQMPTALYVKEHWQPGDLVITNTPHLIDHYLDSPSDYWLESQLFLQATLDDKRSVPIHKYSGTQMIRNLDELREVLSQHNRVWFILEPIFNDRSNTDDVSEFVRSNTDVVFEDYHAVVLLHAHRPALIRQDNELELQRSESALLQ